VDFRKGYLWGFVVYFLFQGDLKNLLMGLLEKDPNKRLGTVHGAKEIIDHPWFKDLRWDLLE